MINHTDPWVLICKVEFDPTAFSVLSYWLLEQNRAPHAAQPETASSILQWEEPGCAAAGTSGLPPAALPAHFSTGCTWKKNQHDFQLWHMKLKVQGNSINGHWDRDEAEDKPHFILLTHLVNSMYLLLIFFLLTGNKLPQDF